MPPENLPIADQKETEKLLQRTQASSLPPNSTIPLPQSSFPASGTLSLNASGSEATVGKQSKTPKIVAVLIVLALIFGGGWITFEGLRSSQDVWTVIKNGGSYLSTVLYSVFKPAEKLYVSLAPAEVESGTEAVFSWTHEGKRGNGNYYFSFECTSAISLTTKGGNTIPCGKELDLGSDMVADNENKAELIVVPHSTDSFAQTPVVISYRADDNEEVSSGAVMRIFNVRATATDKKVVSVVPPTTADSGMVKKPTPSPLPPPTTSAGTITETAAASTSPTKGTSTEKVYSFNSTSLAPQGKPDLAGKVIEIGVIDRDTNVFTATTTPRASDRIAVKFEAINLGGQKTGAWRFNAVLPTYPMHIFHSEDQLSLAHNDRIEFVIGFDSFDSSNTGTSTVIINLDPTSALAEANEDNNLIKAVIPKPSN